VQKRAEITNLGIEGFVVTALTEEITKYEMIHECSEAPTPTKEVSKDEIVVEEEAPL